MTEEDREWSESNAFWEGLLELMFDPDAFGKAGAEVQLVEGLLGLSPRARIVDLCCGPGRHAIELALRGYDVVGVDRTARYLEVAADRAQSAGVCVDLVHADARRFACRPPADAVINLWTSFGYFAHHSDNLQVLRQAHASLRDGGVFLLQMHCKETFTRREPVERTWWERDHTLFLEEHAVVEDWNRVAGRWVVVNDSGRHDYTFRSWLYSGSEMKEMLKEAGFASTSLYGDLTGAPFDRSAKHLVAVATR